MLCLKMIAIPDSQLDKVLRGVEEVPEVPEEESESCCECIPWSKVSSPFGSLTMTHVSRKRAHSRRCLPRCTSLDRSEEKPEYFDAGVGGLFSTTRQYLSISHSQVGHLDKATRKPG